MVPAQQQFVPAQQPMQMAPPQQYYQAAPVVPQSQYAPQPRPVKRSPVREAQSFVDQRPTVKSSLRPNPNYIPDNYSEIPKRKEEQYSFGTRNEPMMRNTTTAKKNFPRNKSAPRDAFQRDVNQYSGPKRQMQRDRSATYKPTTEPRYNTAVKSGYPPVKKNAPMQ